MTDPVLTILENTHNPSYDLHIPPSSQIPPERRSRLMALLITAHSTLTFFVQKCSDWVDERTFYAPVEDFLKRVFGAREGGAWMRATQ